MSNIRKYLPREVPISAIIWDGTDERSKEIHTWINSSPPAATISQGYVRGILDSQYIRHLYDEEKQAYVLRGTVIHANEEERFLFIMTLEGVMAASVGDYIIRGLKGEFYPCKPEVFAEKYYIINENPNFVMDGDDVEGNS